MGRKPKRNSEQGAVLVEFALVAPLVVFLILSFAQIGVIYSIRQNTQEVLRGKARLISEARKAELESSDYPNQVKEWVIADLKAQRIACQDVSITESGDEETRVYEIKAKVGFPQFIPLPIDSLTVSYRTACDFSRR
ncbi:MAG: pilus assembly protein [Candidatus Hadarchaeales archaeon]